MYLITALYLIASIDSVKCDPQAIFELSELNLGHPLYGISEKLLLLTLAYQKVLIESGINL